MPFRIKVSLAIILALLLLLFAGPFLIPVPELEGTSPSREVAAEESEFASVAGVEIHYLDLGSGSTPFLLLHGYPSNAATWNPTLPELALFGRAVAFDRPGFGLSERPVPGSWAWGENPYLPDSQIEQAVALLDELEIDSAVWVASSTGGTIALRAALEHPERVSALVLESTPVYSSRAPPAWSRPLLYTPQMNRLGPLLVRQLGGPPGQRLYASQWAQPERVGEDDTEAFGRTFLVDDWDRGLWEVSKASRTFEFADELAGLQLPVLVVAGAADPIVPAEESERLANELPQSTLALMEGCGHLPHRECPAEFVQVLSGWLEQLPRAGE